MRRKHARHLPGHTNDALKGFTHGGGVTVYSELPDSNAFKPCDVSLSRLYGAVSTGKRKKKEEKKSQKTCVQCNYRVS